MILFHENMHPSKRGEVVALLQLHPETNLCIAYQLADRVMKQTHLDALLTGCLWTAGGRLTRLIKRSDWHYFPPVGTNAFRYGYYPAMDALQGEEGTYYVGGLMNFESVETTAVYSRDLIRQHF